MKILVHGINIKILTCNMWVQSDNSLSDLETVRQARTSSYVRVLALQPQISANLLNDSIGFWSMAQYSKAEPLSTITEENSPSERRKALIIGHQDIDKNIE